MKVENQVHPAPENVKVFVTGKDEPVVMVNLLKFKQMAVYTDGRDSDLTGQQAYALYATAMRKLVEADGGRFIFGGEVEGLLLGEVEDLWDVVGLVEYPTPRSLIRIASSPDFAEIEKHREAGLAGQLNITVRPAGVAD